MTVATGSPDEQIAAQVREGDYDRYLCVQFAPPAARPAMLAVLAFALELDAVHARTTREPMMGALRFAWWREGIQVIYAAGHVPAHPTLGTLADAVRAFALPRAPLDALVDAAEDDARGDGVTLAGLKPLAATIGTAPLTLWLQVLGVSLTPEVAAAIADAGAAWGLVRVAQDHPERDAVIAAAAAHIAAGRARRRSLPAGMLPAMLTLTTAARSLRMLRRGHDPREDRGVARQLTLLFRALLGRY